MKIGFLPVDSRPCTSLFPRQLAEVAGIELLMPSRKMVGFFRQASEQEEVAAWLEGICADCDALVISIEQLLYGGLIASRQGERSEEDCLRYLQQLRQIKQKYPDISIYANTILMRTTVSAVSEESWKWWHQVSEMSHLLYEVGVSCGEEKEIWEKKLKERKEEIPPQVLEQFFQARGRNHKVNLECIELAREGVLEQLLILQEDCSARGIQKLEQEILRKVITENNLGAKVFLHNGADEAAMEQLMKAANPGKRYPVHILWLGGNKEFTARYEDRPFYDNLQGHLQALGMYEDAEAQDCLCILPPLKEQGDYCPKRVCIQDYSENQYERMAGSIAALSERGKRCFLLDLAYANGGDPGFLSVLVSKMDLLSLCGYAAWNTASNSLGTILGQMAATWSNNTEKNRMFTAERLMDDLVYQSIVRQQAEQDIIEAGLDMWGFSDTETAIGLLQKNFAKNQDIIRHLFRGKALSYKIALCWPRTFELEIIVEELPYEK